MVKRMIIPVMASMIVAAGLTGCSDDPNEGIDVYQQYCVVLTPTARAAFANFREGTAAGDRLRIEGEGAVKVNAMTMYFTMPTSPSDPEYTYSCELPMNHDEVIFSLKLNDRTLTNRFDMADVAGIQIPDGLNVISNGTPIVLDLDGLSPSEVSMTLSTSAAADVSSTYSAEVNLVSGSYVFMNVPAGIYNLDIDAYYSLETTDNDGKAGGEIKVVRRTEKRGVRVE